MYGPSIQNGPAVKDRPLWLAQLATLGDGADLVDRLVMENRWEEAIAAMEDLRASADSLLGTCVGEAHQAGLSWAAVGRALGITRAAAWSRFTGYVTPARRGSTDDQ